MYSMQWNKNKNTLRKIFFESVYSKQYKIQEKLEKKSSYKHMSRNVLDNNFSKFHTTMNYARKLPFF